MFSSFALFLVSEIDDEHNHDVQSICVEVGVEERSLGLELVLSQKDQFCYHNNDQERNLELNRRVEEPNFLSFDVREQ